MTRLPCSSWKEIRSVKCFPAISVCATGEYCWTRNARPTALQDHNAKMWKLTTFSRLCKSGLMFGLYEDCFCKRYWHKISRSNVCVLGQANVNVWGIFTGQTVFKWQSVTPNDMRISLSLFLSVLFQICLYSDRVCYFLLFFRLSNQV